MHIESKKSIVQQAQEKLYLFLTDVSNFEKILPDTLEEFESDGDSFKFSLKGMPAIRLVFVEKNEFNFIKLKAASDSFPVFLSCQIDKKTDNQCEVQLSFDGEINAMMAMMIKKPLQNLLDSLVENMSNI